MEEVVGNAEQASQEKTPDPFAVFDSCFLSLAFLCLSDGIFARCYAGFALEILC